MTDYDSLLFPVFNYLRRQGLPLGVSEYLLALKTIQEGMGLENVGRLERLCRLLWAKSQEDQELIHVAFTKFFKPQIQPPFGAEFVAHTITPFSSFSSNASPSSSEIVSEFKTETVLEEQKEQVAFRRSSLGRSRFIKNTPIFEPLKYHLTPRLPIERREMAGVWHQLRHLRREGLPEDLDVEGTINKVCQTGLFLGPVLQPRRRNQAKLLLLIDQHGSMSPFALLIEALIKSILSGGWLREDCLYYFHDCPEGFLYQHPSLTVALPLEEVLSDQAKGNSVLILSDGGAARGYYDELRLTETKEFLKTLSTYTYLYSWLNPMPHSRWVATTAEAIACLIPMFHVDREGLIDAVNILRGHPFPLGVGLDE